MTEPCGYCGVPIGNACFTFTQPVMHLVCAGPHRSTPEEMRRAHETPHEVDLDLLANEARMRAPARDAWNALYPCC